ncbi:DUF92 domain-containing protein [Niabella defluvii]|nr:DUF92 domain-containing protein [Niabella sp. I65]
MTLHIWICLFIIITGMAASVMLKKLTLSAAATGGLFSGCIYAGAGLGGISCMGLFFMLGVISTSWKSSQKSKEGLAEPRKGKRTASQVFANAGAAAIAGFIHFVLPELHIPAPLIIAGCFAAATSDTMSSELGNVYGKRFYNVLSFGKGIKGRNGMISMEGTLVGLLGSVIIAAAYCIWYGWHIHFLLIIIAGMAGNIADSVLGGALENRGLISNNAVNFLNTCIAGTVIIILNAV